MSQVFLQAYHNHSHVPMRCSMFGNPSEEKYALPHAKSKIKFSTISTILPLTQIRFNRLRASIATHSHSPSAALTVSWRSSSLHPAFLKLAFISFVSSRWLYTALSERHFIQRRSACLPL
ncbi:hypothetical protein NPIL_285971 [Nephila pilipes]|uniref:Uncharacterized protein n=1 Tax=Nephila pilipes TaxID=299642 RepID=A0A8X6TEE8_NEPPI|nr:hypothetical protein NPIL_285971 [Nephila pilipes]